MLAVIGTVWQTLLRCVESLRICLISQRNIVWMGAGNGGGHRIGDQIGKGVSAARGLWLVNDGLILVP